MQAADAERIHELQEVVAQGRLFARTGRGGVQEAGWPIAAQIGHEHAAAVGRQRRRHFVETADIVGKSVQQNDRGAPGGAVFFVGDVENVGADGPALHAIPKIAACRRR